VENAFYADKRVAEAAAIGVPDERLGELVGVIVSLHPSSLGVKESDLLESVRPRYVQLLGTGDVIADTLDLRDMLYPLSSWFMMDHYVSCPFSVGWRSSEKCERETCEERFETLTGKDMEREKRKEDKKQVVSPGNMYSKMHKMSTATIP
jgi:acyl-CoA synthetase (AMP-forming)/AMP-acid ligase II